jgi:hypothetical protein
VSKGRSNPPNRAIDLAEPPKTTGAVSQSRQSVVRAGSNGASQSLSDSFTSAASWDTARVFVYSPDE